MRSFESGNPHIALIIGLFHATASYDGCYNARLDGQFDGAANS
jgi:hypothetical protein